MSSLVQAVDWSLVGVPVAVAATAAVVLLADLFLPASRRAVLGWVALTGLLVAGVLLVPLVGESRGTFCVPAGTGSGAAFPACSYEMDGLTAAFQALLLAAAAVVVLLSIGTVSSGSVGTASPTPSGGPTASGGPALPAGPTLPAGEYWFLLLSSTTGALTLVASRDLVTLVVSLEVLTLPTYALVGLRQGDRVAGEAALKYFLVSVVSSAAMLYGVALIYGATGQLFLDRIATSLSSPDLSGVALAPAAGAGVLLALAGFGFKVAAVPFHFWAPEAYVGAPVPVAAYLSVVSKAAGFGGLLLVLAEGFPSYAAAWSPAIAVVALATMTVGNLVALRQSGAVRMLAWSSVAQSGYMLLPLGAVPDAPAVRRAVPATVAYVVAYAAMNLLAFAVVVLVGRHRERNELADYRGLWRTEPLTAAAMAFALTCLAGLPPGLLGLFAKLVVFQVPVRAGVAWLAVGMAVNVVLGLAYYLRWIALLVSNPARDRPPPSYRISVPDGLAIGIPLGATLALSLAPAGILDVLPRGAAFLG